MNNTWFAQLVVAFILAAVAGLYLVPRKLSDEEMNQIVGACDKCHQLLDNQRCKGKQAADHAYCSQFSHQICDDKKDSTGKCNKYPGRWQCKESDRCQRVIWQNCL